MAELTGADPSGTDTVAVDGKSARGSRIGEMPAAHVLAAMTGDDQTVTQLPVPDKTNEITCFAALLEPYNLTGVTVTADALHSQRNHARFLVEKKKAHYLFVVPPARTAPPTAVIAVEGRYRPPLRPRDQPRPQGDPSDESPYRHRPRPGLPPCRPGRAHPTAPY